MNEIKTACEHSSRLPAPPFGAIVVVQTEGTTKKWAVQPAPPAPFAPRLIPQIMYQ